MSKNHYRDKTILRKRVIAVFFVFTLIFVLLICRLFFLMVIKAPELKEKAINQWTNSIKIDPIRGKILDRNGNVLAFTANVYRVDLDLNTLRSYMSSKKISDVEIAEQLSEALDMDSEDVVNIINKTINGKPIGAAILKRRIDKEQADKVRSLNIDGVVVSEDTKRYYPNGNFLAHVLGHTNSDGKGLTGVELVYDSYLSGKPGYKIAETDMTRKQLPYSIADYEKAINGYDVILTVDEMIQHFAEKAAEQALKDNNAKAVSIIVMDPNNGEVLAMVNKPDYDLNNPWEGNPTYDELQKRWRNRAVSDTFEPGSVFKIVTATAALSEGIANENSHFYCKGSKEVDGRVIHCWKTIGHGEQDFADILKNSCNVGFMDLGEKLGAEKLNKYIKAFGFGQKTGIDLNGEAVGIIKSSKSITPVDLATISFGQTDTVSCIQYITALNAIANGGKWIRPHVMKQIVTNDDEKKIITTYDKQDEKQIIDEDVAKQLRGYLEKVVSEGGGKKAYIEGYHIAGKTGTAQKVINGKYVSGKYISSFGGMAPADDPKITVMVSIDEPDPSNYYASQTAAPVAKQLFYDIFNYLALKPDGSAENIVKSLLSDVIIPEVRGKDKQSALKILKDNSIEAEIEGSGEYIVDMNPKPGYTVKEGTKIILYSGSSSTYNKKYVVVPDLTGYNIEKASKILNDLGLKTKFVGSGLVSSQSVSPGQEVNKGTTIVLQLNEIGD